MIRGAPIIKKAILAAARAYARKNKKSLGQVSKACYGDRRFLNALSRGSCSVGVDKVDEVMAFFHHPGNWPDGDVPDAVVDLFAPLEKKKAQPC